VGHPAGTELDRTSAISRGGAEKGKKTWLHAQLEMKSESQRSMKGKEKQTAVETVGDNTQIEKHRYRNGGYHNTERA